MSFLAMNLPGTITQITLGTLSATSGPLVGVYLLGMAFPWATAKSAVISGTLAFSLCLTMTIGSNLYPTDYPRLKPVPTYGCPGTNHSLLESTESNATVNPVITTMTGRFDYILTNYSKLPPMAENRTAAAPLEVQSKDDGRNALAVPGILSMVSRDWCSNHFGFGNCFIGSVRRTF
uniref:Uncharacterized protein n=1 Tax=Magallana gigas TaxID=29159 RepID=A0A8W8MWT9_MAGGI